MRCTYRTAIKFKYCSMHMCVHRSMRDVISYLCVRSTNPSEIFNELKRSVCCYAYSWHSNNVGGESYSPEVSQTSIEESFARADGTGSRSSACFHVIVNLFRTRPRFRERASFSLLFRQIMHINSLFLVGHLCEFTQKCEAFSRHRPTCPRQMINR